MTLWFWHGIGDKLKLKKLQNDVRDLVHALAIGDLCGLLVTGPGGLGKSHSIDKALGELGIEPRVLNSHATSFALYTELYKYRHERVIVVEDLEELFKNLGALQLLRSLTWGPKNQDGSMVRTANWTSTAADGEEIPRSFRLDAGLIFSGNREPVNNQVYTSLKSRMATVRFTVTPADVFEFMRGMVKDGYTIYDGERKRGVWLDSDECMAVIAELEAKTVTDLRMLHHTLALYNRFREGDRWRHLVARILEGSASPTDPQPKRAPLRYPIGPAKKRKATERRIVSDLLARDDFRTDYERFVVYRKKTGKSLRSFRRRVAEIRSATEETRAA